MTACCGQLVPKLPSCASGGSAAALFEGLRLRVGLPARAPDPSVEGVGAHGAEKASMLLHSLGVQKRGQSGVAPAEAARTFLATAEAQARLAAKDC